MYKEFRGGNTRLPESTPETWAVNFAGANKIGLLHRVIWPFKKEFRLIKKYIKATNENPVLYAGCGMGQFVALLNEKNIPAVGLDWSVQMVESLRIIYPIYSWHVGDIREMQFQPDSFSGIISWGVIEHDEQGPEKALTEFERVLKPGGVLIVTVPVDSHMTRRCSRVLFEDAEDPILFFQYFMTENELQEFVKNAGFEIIESGAFGRGLALLFPRLYKNINYRFGLISLLSKIVTILYFWKKDASTMVYCVAMKPK